MMETFQQVRENFQRMEEFGWFSPHEPHTTSKKFFKWPKGNFRNGLGYKQAAVLFLIGDLEGELHVLITKRSTSVNSHKGEQCLPGGNREDGDVAPVDTALREAEEEVGLNPRLVELVSMLPPFASGMTALTSVNPVVCLLKCKVKELSLVPNPDEVQAISWVPIKMFIESHSVKTSRIKWRGLPYQLLGFIHIDPETKAECHIWGLTGRICTSLSAIALNQVPSFPFNSYGVFDVVTEEDGKYVQAVVRSVALTSKHIEQWKGIRVKSRLPVSQWNNAISSKL